MKKILLLTITIIFVTCSLTWARPPRNLQLSYDLEKESLNVKVEHIVDDRNEDYIRKVTVQVNNDRPIDHFNRSQRNMKMYIADFPVTAEPGDTIRVKVYSSEGGTASGELTVVEEEDEP